MKDTEARQVQQLGHAAALVLDSPAFKRAFELLREGTREQWLETSIRDREKQTILLQQAKLIEQLEIHLVRMIQAGEAIDAMKARDAAKLPIDDLLDEGLFRRGMRAAARMRDS